MKGITIPELIIKVFGLSLVVVGLPGLPFLTYLILCRIESVGTTPDDPLLYSNSITHGLHIVVGLALFLTARRLASRYVFEGEQLTGPLSAATLQGTLYACLGLFLSFRSLPAVVYFLLSCVYRYSQLGTGKPSLLDAFTGVGALILFACGFALFIGAKGLVGFRNYIRNLGTRKIS